MTSEKKKTVLIVDDIVENIEILNHLLRDIYTIKAARSGAKALEIVKNVAMPDIILLDIRMPEMDGYEVIKRLKNDPETAHIPVIFVTAQDETFDQTRAFDLGAADYIIKPISPQIVIARVATHIALHETQQHLQARVKEEVAKRIEQEKILLRQSRLAAMGEMMSVITHQWNQPLSVIGTVSASLQFSAQLDTLDKEELLEQLQVIDTNLAFMSQTMLDFKEYFKPGSDKRSFSVLDEIRSVLSMLQPVLKLNRIVPVTEVGEELTGYGIPSELKQVILNLVSNAKDAIVERLQQDDFEPRITITARSDGPQTELTIADNGGGIPPEALERIFENYYTTKAQHGTGIGLSLSKMILEERMNGTIEVRNANGGACFVLRFPAVPATREEVRP